MAGSGNAGEVMWRPSGDRPEAMALNRFLRFLRDRGVAVPEGDYLALHRWSVENVEAFWGALADFFTVDFATQPDAVLGRREMPGAEWFPGAELSYVEHVFRDRDDDAVAVIEAGETRPQAQMTWGELRALTARLAAGLRAAGVGRGDRVAGYLPNVPEAAAAFLAAASLGAVWASCSPDFGAPAVIDRLGQIEPKVLFAVDGYRYGGKDFDRRDVVTRLVDEIPGLRTTVVLPYLGTGGPEGTVEWDAFLASGDGGPLTFETLPFAHPLWVLYSSGTTGLPKGLVHSQGGILLEHLKWLGLQVGVGRGDRLFWLTTTGWTMWNFLVGGLLTGTTIVTWDGNPGHPGLDRLWRLADEAKVTCFGAGASFYASCMKAGIRPAAEHDLSSLRSIGSTGSPLHPEVYDWIYREIGDDVWLFSTSGGTDVCTAFVGGSPLLPVRRGELQAPALGVDVQAWDPTGQRLDRGVGELVVTQPMPSMPVRLWNDPDGERYHAAYFDMYPGVWRHGDWIEITERHTAVISGRSDSTINRGGIRMGTAEIYRAVLALDEITDALVVDLDDYMPLFVVLREGAEMTEELEKAIARRIREDCSPRHVPNEVRVIREVPRTLSGKVLEVPVKRILMGADPDKAASRDSLANPKALEPFIAIAGAFTPARPAGAR